MFTKNYPDRYGFYGRTLETDKAFDAKITEMMREVDQNLGKLGLSAPTQTTSPAAAPTPSPTPTPEPAPAPPTPAATSAPSPSTESISGTKRPSGLPAASAVELTVKSTEPVGAIATQSQSTNPTATFSSSSFSGTRAIHAQHKVNLEAVLELQTRVESMEEVGVLSTEQAEAIDDIVSDFVRCR